MARSRQRKIFDKKKRRYDTLGRWVSGILLGISVCLGISLTNQLFEDPLTMLGIAVPNSPLTPEETWRKYGLYFQKYATKDLSPSFLAALAYSESSGNFLASPKWSIKLARGPFELLKPHNQTIGLLQFTKPQFEQTLDYCIHSRGVELERSWYQFDGCWFNFLSTRLSPANSIEQAAAFMQAKIDKHIHGEVMAASQSQMETFASVLHLCGLTSALSWAEQSKDNENPKWHCPRDKSKSRLEKITKLKNDFNRIMNDSKMAKN